MILPAVVPALTRCQPRTESLGDLVELQFSVAMYGSKPHSAVQEQMKVGLNTEAGSGLTRGNSWFSSCGDVLGTWARPAAVTKILFNSGTLSIAFVSMMRPINILPSVL